MKPVDAPELKRALERLASIWPRKFTEDTFKVWFEILADFDIDYVRRGFEQWPRNNNHFPAPADMRKLMDEERSRRLLMKDKRLQAVDAQQWRNNAGQTTLVKESLQKIKQIKTSPRPPGLAWAVRLQRLEQEGEKLNAMQSRLWREALGFHRSAPAVEPEIKPETEEQREARIEREAIQAEVVMS